MWNFLRCLFALIEWSGLMEHDQEWNFSNENSIDWSFQLILPRKKTKENPGSIRNERIRLRANIRPFLSCTYIHTEKLRREFTSRFAVYFLFLLSIKNRRKKTNFDRHLKIRDVTMKKRKEGRYWLGISTNTNWKINMTPLTTSITQNLHIVWWPS